MLWIYLAIGGYFFLALAALGDRLLLASSTVDPVKYVFLIGVLGGVGASIISAVNFILPDLLGLNFIFSGNYLYAFASAFAAGIFYVLALFAYFSILNKVESSRVVPSIGALIPLFTLIFAAIFLRQEITFYHLLAFLVLVSGAFFVSYKDRKSSLVFDKNIVLILFAALFFSVHFILVKNAYNHLPFIEALVFVQFGFAFAGFALYALFKKKYSAQTSKNTASFAVSPLFVFVNQFFGLIGGGLLQYAIFKGNVVLVNAMQGIQYAFLFLALFIGSYFWAKLLNESYSRRMLFMKLIGVILIASGIALISFKS